VSTKPPVESMTRPTPKRRITVDLFSLGNGGNRHVLLGFKKKKSKWEIFTQVVKIEIA